jgi:hypothetical protein
MYRTECENKLWNNILHDALIILPAVVLGMVAMIVGGISSVLWGQQVIAFAVFALLGLLRRAVRRIPSIVWISVLLAGLVSTLFFPAVGGAKRWLDLGLLNVNVAMLALPALLLLVSNMKRSHLFVLLVAAVLCLQPDLSQLAAFSLGVLPILWKWRKNVCWTIASLVLLMLFAIRCINTPVELESIAYCEGILRMVGEISPLLMIAGGIALALIPVYFIYRFSKTGSTVMLGLAIYYAVTILFSITGEYPVPFMGFGLSPIAGYFLAYLFMTQEETARG